MQNLNGFVRGALATSVVFCLMSVGAFAQSNSSSQSGTNQPSQNSSSMNSDGNNSSSGQLSQKDQHFVKHLIQGNMAEVELGRLAQQKASSQDVKQFAQRMVNDHTKLLDQTKQLAQQKGIQVPTSLDAKDQALKQKLSSLSGEQFDRAYMRNMVKDHKHDVAELQKKSNNAQDPSVKQLASQALPIIQSHLQEAQQVRSAEMKEMKGQNNGSTTASANPRQQH